MTLKKSYIKCMEKKVWVVAPGVAYEGILGDYLRVFASEQDALTYLTELEEDEIGDPGYAMFQCQEVL